MRLIKPYTLLVWKIVMVDEVRQWLHGLRRTDRDTLRQVSDAPDLLAIEGPALGRPIVDRIKGSRLHHLKELRPGSSGASEVRILVAGDKAGDWKRWYVRAVALAEHRYEQWIKEAGS
jgi:hypothetical protein